jgi:hypothetical protein
MKLGCVILEKFGKVHDPFNVIGDVIRDLKSKFFLRSYDNFNLIKTVEMEIFGQIRFKFNLQRE